MSEPVWQEWGPPLRVRVDAASVWTFARAVKDMSPVYASDRRAAGAGFTAVPAPPTFTFALAAHGAWPDLQPDGSTGALMVIDASTMAARPGLSLHGEQEFVYHRQPLVGDVLEGRMRTSVPWRKGSGRVMEMRLLETVWSDLGGSPVVTERITAIYLPTPEELGAAPE